MKVICITLFWILPIILWAQQDKYNKAVSAFKESDFEVALNLLNELKVAPYVENDVYSESDIYYLLALIYIENDDDHNSAKIIEEGFARFPGNSNLVNAFCTKLIREENYDEPIALLDSMLVKHPENKTKYLFLKGRICLQKDDFLRAEPVYDLLLSLDTSNKFAMMDIGYYSKEYAYQMFDEINRSDKETAVELRKKGIYYLKKSAKYLRYAYNLFSDEERCNTNVYVFLNEVCGVLFSMDEDIEEYVEDIDTSNYYCD